MLCTTQTHSITGISTEWCTVFAEWYVVYHTHTVELALALSGVLCLLSGMLCFVLCRHTVELALALNGVLCLLSSMLCCVLRRHTVELALALSGVLHLPSVRCVPRRHTVKLALTLSIVLYLWRAVSASGRTHLTLQCTACRPMVSRPCWPAPRATDWSDCGTSASRNTCRWASAALGKADLGAACMGHWQPHTHLSPNVWFSHNNHAIFYMSVREKDDEEEIV